MLRFQDYFFQLVNALLVTYFGWWLNNHKKH